MSADPRVAEALAWLERRGSARVRDQMRDQFGITAPRAFGVKVSEVQALGRRLGRDHALALALWATGWYEARLLTAFVDEPARVTVAQMDRWARDFDNWGICDTLCFALWDRTPHAWGRVTAWSRRREEFVKRAAFALLAGLALHDKTSPDARFLKALPLIRRAATDERNFVKKGVSWALRVMGRRSAALNTAAVALSRELAAMESAPARFIGKESLRELTGPLVTRRLAAKAAKATGRRAAPVRRRPAPSRPSGSRG